MRPREMSDLDLSGVVKTTLKILQEHTICDNCLGRQFAWLGTGISNKDRGHSIKLTLTMIADEQFKVGNKGQSSKIINLLAENGMFEPAKLVASQNSIEYDIQDACHLCSLDNESIFDKIQMISDRMKGMSDDYEFSTFLVGSVPSSVLVERQDELSARCSILYAETLKSHLNREIGSNLQRILRKEVDFEKPDIVFVYLMEQDEIRLQVNPIFIYGRYQKLVRGIPQSRWDCKKCKGRGCDDCKGTGRKYPDSISEYIGIPAQLIADGSKFKLHAAGREDVDVLMLGNGRPFVVEISEPRVRSPDLHQLAHEINEQANDKIKVHNLQTADRLTLQKLKEKASSNVKEYRALITVEQSVTNEILEQAETFFRGTDIEQRTPTRVSHRRSDLVRKKRIYEIHLKKQDENLLEGVFKVQGGTYIKELISGDDGRTIPSITEKLGTKCICKELNVIAIYSNDANEHE
ncbi:tRNA pseudouridine(54/55) synthase Pus10 [Candidatus Thorarchaeota archaeon]|nr:MAG: tRNA pseudouridine(54/55) synthase Pus10 [Candidatus Thorarchaeota archaeon]